MGHVTDHGHLSAVCHQKANDLIWATCVQNLTTLALAVTEIICPCVSLPFLRYGEISVENRRFQPTSPVFRTPVGMGVSPLEYCLIGVRKLESLCNHWTTWALFA